MIMNIGEGVLQLSIVTSSKNFTLQQVVSSPQNDILIEVQKRITFYIPNIFDIVRKIVTTIPQKLQKSLVVRDPLRGLSHLPEFLIFKREIKISRLWHLFFEIL